MSSRSPRWTLLACVAFGLACGVAGDIPAGDLKTLADFLPAARGGAPIGPAHLVSLKGQPIDFLSAPYGTGTVLQDSANDGLAIYPSFSEGKPAAYTITETWYEFPKVWVQPLYVFVTGFDPSSGGPVVAANNKFVFGVSPESRFYSPYWQIYYTVIPADSPQDKYTSEKDIFDANLPLIEGALTVCVLTPPGVSVVQAQGDVPRRPITGEALNPPGIGTGWVDGELWGVLDFGRNRFRADSHLVVQESALFRFALRDPATGANIPLDLPTVGGTGPLGHPAAPLEVGNVPQFGTFWHEYDVVLNPTNRSTKTPGFFVPPSNTALRQHVLDLVKDARWAPLAPASIETNVSAQTLKEYTLRVAQNAADCFADPAFPGGSCVWLDNQRTIEGTIPSALIIDTEKLSTCPILLFNGVATP